MGRLTKDPELRYTDGNGGNQEKLAICRYTLAVNRKFAKEGGDQADFINCVVFGKGAEFSSKYFTKGQKVAVSGRIQTGSYTNKDGAKVFTTDVVVEEQDFAESKKSASSGASAPASSDYTPIPDAVEDTLPF